MWLFGGKFMLVLLIAEYSASSLLHPSHTQPDHMSAFSIGLATRFGLHANPESRGIYIVENLLVVLSPCGFIAANYILLGRLALWLGCDQHLLIPRRRITLIFVLSDVFTFLVQVCSWN